MKRVVYMVVVALLWILLEPAAANVAEAGSLSVRGVWVSCFEYGDIGLTADKTESEFVANADRVFANIRSYGCNTVYFHVRSFDDAIYPSSVTGWSERFLNGSKAPSYNPLKLLVRSAHRAGLKFHAWMNPYRVTMKKTLDPGDDATTSRIVKQVKEILNHYDVDGIHFDDYFYTSEKKYKDISEKERMENVSKMVHKVHKACRNKGKIFGISPAGDISYCRSIGADVETWLSKKGYVDYIIPQLYWSDEYKLNGKKKKLFKERLAKWRSINKTDRPMYIGLALYKAGEKVKNDMGWRNSSTNISRQINQIRSGNSEGYVLFCYSDLFREGAKKELTNYLGNIATIRISAGNGALKKGKTRKMSVAVWPSMAAGKLKIRTGNTKIATVNSKGVITAKKPGKVRIYVSCGKKVKSCLIKVKK